MIPYEYIDQWTETHPWRGTELVEQDLLLDAVLHQVAASQHSQNLIFIGGTCLHKLYGRSPRRYSEDLDFVWTGDESPDDALREIAERCRVIGFREVEVVPLSEARFPKVLFYYSDHAGRPAKMKLELNLILSNILRGHATHQELHTSNGWLTASSPILCAPLSSLAGMKIIAGSLRSKPRDLYDLHDLRHRLQVTEDAATQWVKRMQPEDWKPARRHRHVKRMLRREAFWEDLNNYLHVKESLTPTDHNAMAETMLNALGNIQA